MTGVLIVRDDGVIVVPDAIPWPAGLAATVEHVLDALDIRSAQDQQQYDDEREDRT